MKPELPKELVIGYIKYNVLPVTSEYADDNNFVGISDYSKQVIKINEVQPPNELINTLIHEILHCCNFYFGMKEQVGTKIEERFVDSLANGLTSVIRDNPEFLKWIEQNIER